MSFTTKSESVPVVETRSDGVIGPAIGDVVIERLRFVDQHIGPRGGEALIVGHVVAGHAQPGAISPMDGHRLGGIAQVLVEAGRPAGH